jgi:hypothetical protein
VQNENGQDKYLKDENITQRNPSGLSRRSDEKALEQLAGGCGGMPLLKTRS